MKIFLCEDIHPAALARLRGRGEIVGDWEWLCECDGLINRNLRLPREVLERASRLRAIVVHGTGSDGIDLKYCDAHGITVAYVPGENSASVAELIAALALDLARHVTAADRALRDRRVSVSAPAEFFGFELRGKTLGLIGAGDIARRAAKILRGGFGMKVLAYSPSLTPAKAAAFGASAASGVEEVLAAADVISLGVHLTESTRGMIGARELALVKPGAVLINTALGSVVDEDALYDALRHGPLGGAAVDVWTQEPPVEHKLLTLPNVIATPHLGANTEEALRRVGEAAVEALFAALEGRLPKHTYDAAHPMGRCNFPA